MSNQRLYDVQDLWDIAWEKCKGETDLSNARIGGRATKANPNKEDVNFWQNAGPRWVDGYHKQLSVHVWTHRVLPILYQEG
jgi:hypothetical protein